MAEQLGQLGQRFALRLESIRPRRLQELKLVVVALYRLAQLVKRFGCRSSLDLLQRLACAAVAVLEAFLDELPATVLECQRRNTLSDTAQLVGRAKQQPG